MYGRTFIFVENFHVSNLSVVLEIFHVFNFRGTRHPRKLFNLEHFPIYGICLSWDTTKCVNRCTFRCICALMHIKDAHNLHQSLLFGCN